MTKVLVAGDIGQPVYHVGDEAMTVASATFFAGRGARIVLATRDEEHSRQLIGAGAAGEEYEYLPYLLFPWAPAQREQTLELLEEYLRSGVMPALPEFAPDATKIRAFVEGVCAVDAVVISGGGNLNSRYGWLLYERAAIALVAEYRKIPLFISGQSLGPVLSNTDAEVLERMLRSAVAVAVRERGSYAWCTERGIEALAGADDATDYTPHSPELTLEYPESVAVPERPQRYVCVTINDADDEQAQNLAELLEYTYQEHGLSTVFLSHMGNPAQAAVAGERGDYEVHARIAEQMHTPATLVPITHADAAVRIHQGAALTLTSRYHPAVFGLAVGVPVVALVPDAFTEMRLTGVMKHYGVGEFITPLEMLGTAIPSLLLDAAVQLNDPELGATFTELQAPRRAEVLGALAEWRQYVWERISGNDEAREPQNLPKVHQVEALNEPLRGVNRAARRLLRRTSLEAGNEWALSDRMHSWEDARRHEIEGKDREIAGLRERAEAAERKLAEYQGSLLKRILRR